MKAITIHGLDETLAEALAKRARKQGESVNQLVKRLLGEAVGVKLRPTDRPHAEFADFCGVWSEEDRRELERRTAEFERVDSEDWT